MKDIKDVPLEIIKDRKEFQNHRVPQIEQEFELEKIIVEENTFGYGGIIAISPIEFSAKCEHHLVGIHGEAYFAYIPNKYLMGLSQISHIIEYSLNVTQEIIQEEATKMLADYIEDIIKPQGLWLVIKATHECMSARGVRQRNSRTATSEIRGAFNREAVRSETIELWKLP